jgi:hypothetical protein
LLVAIVNVNAQEAVKLQNYINSLFGEKKNKVALSHEVREGIRKKNEIQEEWMAEEITRYITHSTDVILPPFPTFHLFSL